MAVSGGCDSVVLLHLLHGIGHRKLVVCHLNHGLRGRASGGDARFVRALALRLDLPCEVEKAEVARLAQREGKSIELAAREARHAFFAEAARRHRCRRVVLAHHADDQVETVLMNVLRGTGLAGLAGMSPETQLRIGGQRLQLIRPLLATTGSALRAFAAERRIPFREDESNALLGHLRNRVRHDLLPQANRVMDREVRGALLRLAEIAGEEEALLRQLTEEALLACQHPEADGALAVAPLHEFLPGLRSRVVRAWLQASGVRDLDRATIRRVVALLDRKDSPAKTNLPGGGWARRNSGRLFLQFPEARST